MRLNIPGDNFFETPLWWQNFVMHCEELHPSIHGKDFYKLTAKILKNEYNAIKIYEDDALIGLEFVNPAMISFFMLKWS